jgi:hypothetical protein
VLSLSSASATGSLSGASVSGNISGNAAGITGITQVASLGANTFSGVQTFNAPAYQSSMPYLIAACNAANTTGDGVSFVATFADGVVDNFSAWSGNNTYTTPFRAFWSARVQVNWTANGTGYRECQLYINGVLVEWQDQNSNSASNNTVYNFIFNANAGNTITVKLQQTSGTRLGWAADGYTQIRIVCLFPY